ncbi:MAG: GNAT family N-acetyltransferase [Pseudomonadota bacterium]
MSEGADHDLISAVRLARADVVRVYALYLSALAAVPNPAAVRPDEPGFFDTVFDDGGEILGLEADGVLIAYGVIRPELAREHDRVGLEGIVAPDARLWVLDGSAVHPAWWRHGFQRTIIKARLARLGELLGAAAGHAIAKASPGNLPSLRNLLKCGFVTVEMIEKPYGWRYVQYRPVDAPVSQPSGGRWINAGAVEDASARFARGEVANACHGEGLAAELRFVAMPGLRAASGG